MNRRDAFRPDPVSACVAAVCIAIEVVLVLSDYGILGYPRLRLVAYAYGGFWPGLLADWKPNYPFQPVAMFVTYSFLHGGPVHLAVNMLTLFSLGRNAYDRVGPLRYVLIYTASTLGGAISFGLLAPSLTPMVGASGALFGLAGGLVAWEWTDRREANLTVLPVLKLVGILVILNVVLWWAMDGQLAWETHLGGFLAGLVAAFLVGTPPERSG